MGRGTVYGQVQCYGAVASIVGKHMGGGDASMGSDSRLVGSYGALVCAVGVIYDPIETGANTSIESGRAVVVYGEVEGDDAVAPILVKHGCCRSIVICSVCSGIARITAVPIGRYPGKTFTGVDRISRSVVLAEY